MVADLFGLNWSDLELVLKDFPLLDKCQKPLRGERCSTITRDLLHSTWLSRHTECPVGCRPLERVLEATEAGAIAYVASEHAKSHPH